MANEVVAVGDNYRMVWDKDTHKFVGYAKKEGVLSVEALEQFKGTPVKAHVKVEEGGVRFCD